MKFGDEIEIAIGKKFYKHKTIVHYLANNSSNKLYYRSAGGGYWISVLNAPFDSETSSNKDAAFDALYNSKVFSALLNSSLFWWYYSTNYDLFNFTHSWMFNSCLNYPNSEMEKALIQVSQKLEEHLRNNALHYTINSKTNGCQETVTYQKYLSKSIIDEIDKLLAQHYGFTEEELDFIINYDIKYRMGAGSDSNDSEE